MNLNLHVIGSNVRKIQPMKECFACACLDEEVEATDNLVISRTKNVTDKTNESTGSQISLVVYKIPYYCSEKNFKSKNYR